MGDLDGRTFVVTGGNTGIGLATCTALAGRGGRIYLTSRSKEKGEAAVSRVVADTGNDAVSYLLLDLADLASVRTAAAGFLALGEPVHALINNAGLAGRQGLTADGFELTFGVNHLGHYAFTMAMLGRLRDSNARVVTVASDAHYQARGIDFGALRRRGRGITGMHEYAVSKLCNVLFSQELASRENGVPSYVLHPGVVASDIWRRVPWPIRPLMTRRMLTIDQGARTSVFCATAPELAGVSGRYYDDCAEREPSRVATPDLARQLWEHSAEWVGAA